jgi:KipI family sensor histidine kinase inhibitor
VTVEITPFGDSALLVETGSSVVARRLADAIEDRRRRDEAPPGIEDVVVGLHTVVVLADPATDWAELSEWLSSLPSDPDHGRTPRPRGTRPDGASQARSDGLAALDLPVEFDGEDLDEVAGELGIDATAVIELLCGAELQVAFVGFAPGFPYLVGLPPELAALSRRPTPRSSVPAGSVAVAGGFSSVYPRASPGGWRLLGRTAVRLFDPEHPPFALLRPGDRVRFTDATTDEAGRASRQDRLGTRTVRSPLVARGELFVEVEEPGALTLVQDGGRAGLASIGVPRSGPADAAAMALANLLVGNDAAAAAFEITAVGPSLRFARSSHIAVVSTSGGAPDETSLTIDGHRHETAAVIPVGAGQLVRVDRVRPGLRAYLAVAGGLATERVLGSRSSDVLSGLGPGPLHRGDVVELGAPVRPRGLLEPATRGLLGHQAHVIGVIPGPHYFGPDTLAQFLAERWTVAADSNRIGVRLSGERPLPGPEVACDSLGMVTGAIQVPPSGTPIILLADHATVGGYPVLACVTTVEVAKVAQLAPGDSVVFVEVGLDEARAQRSALGQALADRVSGWFPTEAGT